jgi:biopolymer transport protein ExbD
VTIGKREGRYAAPPLAEINIVPLVDVTLVILIIFMVTMTFKKPDKPEGKDPVFALPITLPASNAAKEGGASGATLALGVDRFGHRYVGNQPATTEVLLLKVREAAKTPDASVRIDADRAAPFQSVVELVEACQIEGMRNVQLHTSNPH